MDAGHFDMAATLERPDAVPLFGTVDKLDAPATIGGWVNTAAHPGKGRGITIMVSRHNRPIGTGRLSFARQDIIADPDYLTGFELTCGETIPEIDFVFGAVTVAAMDENGHQTPLTLYEHTRSTAFERAVYAAPDLGKDVAAMLLTALARNPEFPEDARAALRDVNDRFFRDSDRALLYHFESLGADCSLGGIQRLFGAEPIGLWRFSGVEIDALITALKDRLAGIGLPEFTQIYTDEQGEYYTSDRRYHMPTHTYVYQGEVDLEQFYRERCRQIRFLVRNMLEKLQKSRRIFVVHDLPGRIAEDRLMALQAAMRGFGDAPLLYLQPPDAAHEAGSLLRREDGILTGFVPAIRGDVMNPSGEIREAWMRALRQAKAMADRSS